MPSPPELPRSPDIPSTGETGPEEPIVPINSGWWYRIGGGSLTVSIIIHAVVIVLAVIIVWQVNVKPPETIDFLPGGGGGGKGNEAKAAMQRRAATMSAPKTRIVSIANDAAVSLPDLQTSMSDFSSLSMAAPMGGGIGGGIGGLSGRGSGGQRGDGRGSGFGPGSGSGFVSIPMIFGQKIDAQRMAVVLDMSGSMYPFLPTVIKEVDKVAPGSVVILHYGCGLGTEEPRSPKIERTSDRDFDKDRIATALMESNTASMNADERAALLELVKKRPKTYFVPSTRVATTWIALTDSELRNADAIYWFADFADTVTDAGMEEVERKLRIRKQKLYIHPSNPNWLIPGDPLAMNVARIENAIVTPSGGKVIKADVKKDVPVKEDKKTAKPAA